MADFVSKYMDSFSYAEVGKETCVKIFLTKLEEAVTRKPHLLKDGEKMAVVSNKLMKQKKFKRDNFLYFAVKRKTMETISKKGALYLDVDKLPPEMRDPSAVDLRTVADCQYLNVKNVTPGISSISTTVPREVKLKNIRPQDVDFQKPVAFTRDELKQKIVEGVAKMEGTGRGFRAKYMVGQDYLLEDDDTLYGEPMSKVDNPLQVMSSGIGLVTPYRYVAVGFSPFALHIEDFRGINSTNVVICGHPKIWIIIPKREFDKLCSILEKVLPSHFAGVSKCSFLHKNIWLHPFQLSQWGIDYNIIIQRAGEMVVTGCATFHQGFNLGWNVATAINLILYDFISSADELRNRPHCVNIPRSFFRDQAMTTSKNGTRKKVSDKTDYNIQELSTDEAVCLYDVNGNDCVHLDFMWEQRSVLHNIVEVYMSGIETGYNDDEYPGYLSDIQNPYENNAVSSFFISHTPFNDSSNMAPAMNPTQPTALIDASRPSSGDSSLFSDALGDAYIKAEKRSEDIADERKKFKSKSKNYYKRNADKCKQLTKTRYVAIGPVGRSVISQQQSVRQQKKTDAERAAMNKRRRDKRKEKMDSMTPEEKDEFKKRESDKFKKLRMDGRIGIRKKVQMEDDNAPASA